jgi:hypothetical protein
VDLGGNDFFGVPFPVVVADRFFHIYEDGHGRFSIDVFRWDEALQLPTYEVRASMPLRDNIDTNPTGIVTFAQEGSGVFLFKFRPKPGVSQIFGHVPVEGEVTVRITDRELIVMRGDQRVATFRSNTVSGFPIGIEVGADGSIGVGVNRLPDGMVLVRRVGAPS